MGSSPIKRSVYGSQSNFSSCQSCSITQVQLCCTFDWPQESGKSEQLAQIELWSFKDIWKSKASSETLWDERQTETDETRLTCEAKIGARE